MLLYIAVVILVVLWLLGLLTGHTMGSLSDGLLVIAAILILARFLVLIVNRFDKK
jgi:hypothetical protein